MTGRTVPIDTEIYTIQDVTALLGCDEDTAAARIKNGDLPGTKFGRGWVAPRQAFIERLNEKARTEAAERQRRHSQQCYSTRRLPLNAVVAVRHRRCRRLEQPKPSNATTIQLAALSAESCRL